MGCALMMLQPPPWPALICRATSGHDPKLPAQAPSKKKGGEWSERLCHPDHSPPVFHATGQSRRCLGFVALGKSFAMISLRANRPLCGRRGFSGFALLRSSSLAEDCQRQPCISLSLAPSWRQARCLFAVRYPQAPQFRRFPGCPQNYRLWTTGRSRCRRMHCGFFGNGYGAMDLWISLSGRHHPQLAQLRRLALGGTS